MSVQSFDASKSDAIIRISESAKIHFSKQLARSGHKAIRLSLKQAGCTGYKYVVDEIDSAPATDLHLQLNNGVDIFIDSQYLSAIRGAEVDIRQQGLNVNLVVDNPNVQDECGCGESFSIKE